MQLTDWLLVEVALLLIGLTKISLTSSGFNPLLSWQSGKRLISSYRVKAVFAKRDMGQTNEPQRHFNKWPISKLHGEVDSIQTGLKLLFASQQ
jgi:hypothetical protein